MARAGLRWYLKDLAKASGVDRATINRFELGKQNPGADWRERETLARLGRAFEDAGIEFGDDGWVRVRPVEAEAVSSE